MQPDTEHSEHAGWNPLTRIVFRFTFLYFGLFCLTYPQLITEFGRWFITWLGGSTDAVIWQTTLLGPLLGWVGRTVFGVDAVVRGTGSGDQTIYWVQLFCLLVVATVGTAAWTLLARRRTEHRRLAGWFLLFVRLCVAGQMLNYGFGKLIPTQMPEPGLTTLLTPYGEFTPMGVLWNQVGTSMPYQILLGAAEVLAGVLLFIPRTAVVGAMLSVVSMAQVFVLNLTFDVPVKILSGHLLLMSLLLLAPQARRLVEVLVLDRATGPSTAPYPFRTRTSRRIAAAVQIALGIWIGSSLLHVSMQFWRDEGPDRPKPPLYGIWAVQDFARDGQAVPPLLTDETRWQRIVFDYPGVMDYQRMDGTLVPAQVKVDTATHRVELADLPAGQDAQPKPLGTFTFQQPGPDRLRLEGELDGHPVTITLDRVDPNTFPLRSTGFHWIRDE
ncbi:DoxX family protein [Nocardia transvalensis]|nr:DoxX family protein [Nocardia transvalensis]